ncbi:MAG: 50S ribosomal protein L35 [Bdellovibrionales bacterium]|nr:50S ribosomal protein L35 [Bdellovibrionales bacterium]
MKAKTHSGAKKRIRVLSRDKMKRKQARLRHLLKNKSSKRKRHLGDVIYVDSANIPNTRRCFNI